MISPEMRSMAESYINTADKLSERAKQLEAELAVTDGYAAKQVLRRRIEYLQSEVLECRELAREIEKE